MAAKYCWLNNASLQDFDGLLRSLLVDPEAIERLAQERAIDGDIEDLSMWHLTRAFCEPASTLRSMSRRDFLPQGLRFPVLGLVEGSSAFSEIDEYRLHRCRICLKQGYHSLFHELNWLDFCVFHPGERLQRPGWFESEDEYRHEGDAVKRNFRLFNVSALRGAWTSSSSEFFLGKSGMYKTAPTLQEPDSVRSLRSKLKAVATTSASGAHRLQVAWGGSPAFQAFQLFSDAPGDDAWKQVFDAKELAAQRSSYRLAMSRAEAFEIVNSDWSEQRRIPQLTSRMLSCHAYDLKVPWRASMAAMFKRLRVGHEACIAQFAKFLSKCDPKLKEPWGCTPACSLDVYGLCLCPRLRTLDLISHACEPHAYTGSIETNSSWPFPGIGNEFTNRDLCRVLPRLPVPTHHIAPEYGVSWSYAGQERSVSNYLSRRLHVAQPPESFTRYLDVLLDIQIQQIEAAAAAAEAQRIANRSRTSYSQEGWRDFTYQMIAVQPLVRTSVVDDGLLIEVWTPPAWRNTVTSQCDHAERRYSEIKGSITNLQAAWPNKRPEDAAGLGDCRGLPS